MLMVVLGAGASHDSTSHFQAGMGVGYPNDELRPPLTNDLFHPRFKEAMRQFPDVKPLAGYLHTSIEDTLQSFQEEAEVNQELLKSLMAVRHYVPRVVGECETGWLRRHEGITNHSTLLSRIDLWCQLHNERACFVTFNYDTFIEQAFTDSTRRIRMRELGEYVSDDRYKVIIKLHGSVTWFHEVQLPALLDVHRRNADELAQELIARAPEVRFSNEFLSADRATVGKIGDHGPIVVPAIAIPVQQKPGPGFDECPDKHIGVLKACLPSVTRLIVIGWAGKEKTFLEMLRGSLSGSVLGVVVGQNRIDAERIIGDLITAIPGSFKPSTAEGFSDFIKTRAVDEYLFR